MTWLFRALSRLPLPVLYGLGRGLGFLLFNVLNVRGGVVMDNLARSFPERSKAERRQLWRAYHRQVMDVAMETIKGFTLPAEQLRERVVLEGFEPVLAEIAAGRSLMIVTSHHCNWEWLLLRLTEALPCPVDAIYKTLQPAGVDEAFLAMRSRFGGRMVSAKEVLKRILGRRENPRVIALVADQVPLSAANKIWLKFLGQDTAFFAGPEEISRALKLPVYFLAMERLELGRYRVTAELLSRPGEGGEVPKETTRRYAQRLEAHLLAHPADWFWGHRRWKLQKPLYGK
jgi:KDO2-lipid IV(A) lauroyltransferase